MIKSAGVTVLSLLLLSMGLNTASFLTPLVCLSHFLYTKNLCLGTKYLSSFSKSDLFLLKLLAVSTVL